MNPPPYLNAGALNIAVKLRMIRWQRRYLSLVPCTLPTCTARAYIDVSLLLSNVILTFRMEAQHRVYFRILAHHGKFQECLLLAPLCV